MGDNAERTDQPFEDALRGILAERKMSLRALAREVGVDHAHLSRALRGVSHKTLTEDLMARVGRALGLPPGYFAEEREAVVVRHIRSDAALRDWLYNRVSHDR